MEKYNFPDDVKVFGFQAKTFPHGIGEAFAELIKMLPEGDQRPYYGISECTKEGFIYKAAALETYDGEAEKYGCEKYVVEKGEYLTETVLDWRSKTNCINSVFGEIFKDEHCDKSKPCIELYKNEEEMICMVKADERKEIQGEFEAAAEEFLQIISSLSEEQINTIPFEGSWTAAQVAEHVIKANTGIVSALKQEGKIADRNKSERAEELKKLFLDFTTKLQSPDFVLPTQNTYQKETLIADFRLASEQLIDAVKIANLSEIVKDSALGDLTKYEMLYFVTVHTQRHVHQLKGIVQKVTI